MAAKNVDGFRRVVRALRLQDERNSMGYEQLVDLPRRIKRNIDCPHTKMGDRELEIMVEPIIEYLDNLDMTSSPPLAAADLHAKWVNGNRKDVMRALTAMSSMRAACTTAFMMVLFSDVNGSLHNSDAEAFISMMQGRLK